MNNEEPRGITVVVARQLGAGRGEESCHLPGVSYQETTAALTQVCFALVAAERGGRQRAILSMYGLKGRPDG